MADEQENGPGRSPQRFSGPWRRRAEDGAPRVGRGRHGAAGGVRPAGLEGEPLAQGAAVAEAPEAAEAGREAARDEATAADLRVRPRLRAEGVHGDDPRSWPRRTMRKSCSSGRRGPAKLAPFLKLARTIREQVVGILAYLDTKMTKRPGGGHQQQTAGHRAPRLRLLSPTTRSSRCCFLCCCGIESAPPRTHTCLRRFV